MSNKINLTNIEEYRDNPVVRELLEASNDGFWDWNIATGEVYFSKRWAEMLGYEQDEIDPHVRSWEKIVHPDDMPHVMEVLQKHLNGETDYYETEHRVLTKNGEWKWILDRGRVICRDAHGTPLRASGSHTDITEKKRHEQERENLLRELEKNQAFIKTIMTLSSDLIYIKDTESRIITANEALLKIVKRADHPTRMEDILGKNDIEFLDPEAGKRIVENDKMILKNKKTVSIEEITPSSSGGIIFDSIKSPIFDSKGEVIGLIGISRNITERKKMEDKLKNAIMARDEFLSIASHELKTPLTSLLLQAQSILRNINLRKIEEFTPEKLTKFSLMIEQQIQRLVRLVDDMLDISRIQSGKLAIHEEEFDFLEAIVEVSDKFETQIRNATGQSLVRESLPSIKGNWDRQRVEQVISNLLSNAIKYGEAKPIHIGLFKYNEKLKFFIKDHGLGIKKDNVERIFQRFERAVSANAVSGLGLGLYITKQIVESHQGKIWVESEVGSGSTFWVELPLNKKIR